MSIILGITAGFINGMFGSGAGLVLFPGLVFMFNMDGKTARGTVLLVLTVLTLVSTFFYAKNISDFQFLWFVVVGGILGGTLGAKFTMNIKEKYLKIILGIFMIFSGLKMLFGG